MIQSSDFRVKVREFSESETGGKKYYGEYISKVYAINEDHFLVWDPGDYEAPGGFTWVDFTETIFIGEREIEIDGFGKVTTFEKMLSVVELVEDEDEQQK